MAEELVEMAEAARRLGVTPGELSMLVAEGKLKSVEVQGVPKFRAADLEAYLADKPEEEELVLLPEEEEKEEETETIPLAGVRPEAAPGEVPPAAQEPTVEVGGAEEESLFADEGLAEVEEAGEEVSAAEVVAAEAEERAGEPVTPALEAFAAARRGEPVMTVLLVITLLLLIFSGILVMNFVKFVTTGGAPQGILEWLTSRIAGG